MDVATRDLATRSINRVIVAAIAACAAAFAVVTPASALASDPNPRFAVSAPVVGVSATPTGNGFWQVARDGGVFASGDATFYGSAGAVRLNQPIVGMAPTPTGRGYWLVASDGGIFGYGDAVFYGSTGGMRLNQPIVGMAATPTGRGYWLVASDGGIFGFGDAAFYGSTGGIRLNQRIVGMAANPAGRGYWLVAADGGIFGFGDAGFYGSTGALELSRPIVGMAAAPDGRGYLLVAADGGAFQFGAAPFYGSAAGACQTAPAVGVATSIGATGYWISFGDARAYAFSPSNPTPSCALSGRGAEAAAQDFLARLNAERAARGRPVLAWDPALADYARSWSQTMSGSGFRHSNLGDILQTDRFGLVGENISSGHGNEVTAGSLHSAWMSSDGHRENMLSPAWDLVGIGVYCAPDGSMWATTNFGRTMGAGAAPPRPPMPPTQPIVRSDPGSSSC